MTACCLIKVFVTLLYVLLCAVRFWVRIGRYKIQFIHAWYDMWVGAYWDRRENELYVFPIPWFGIRIKRRAKCN